MSEIKHYTEDYWSNLKAFTNARIALGRAGGSLNTQEQLKLFRAHALARDAVHASLSHERLTDEVNNLQMQTVVLHTKARTREEFLLRPDWGRNLSNAAMQSLTSYRGEYDIALIAGDGLSAKAVHAHLPGLLHYLIPKLNGFEIAPLCIVHQARVAVSDEIGETLNSKMSIIFIGERPGLSASESLGIYLTYQPKKGNTDEKRNCISNVRPEGMPYQVAADKLVYLVNEAMRRKISGVKLKEDLPISLEE